MTTHIHAAWDFSRIGAATIEVLESSSGKAVTVTFATGVYSHVALAGATSEIYSRAMYFPHLQTDTSSGVSWISAFLTALNATTASGSYVLTGGYSGMRYTLSCSGDTFKIGTNTNTLGTYLLGMSAGGDYAASKTSTFTPHYSIAVTRGGLSNVSDDYEPEGMCENAEADDGTVYGIGRTTYPLYHDFTVPMEPKETTRKRDAETTAPWTYQHLWQHVRNSYEFAVLNNPTYYTGSNPVLGDQVGLGTSGDKATVHRLRAEGASWKPERVSPDYDDLWTLHFKTHLTDRGKVA